MAQFSLSPEQVEHYHTEGYVVVENLFDANDLRKVDQTLEDLVEQALASKDYEHLMEFEPGTLESGEPAVRRLFDPFLQHQAFKQLATDPRIIHRIASLIGEDLWIQHSKLNMKPAKTGSAVDWHQDLAFFPHTNPDLVTTLVHLDDATQKNGCLQVIPRHHHHFFNHTRDDGLFAGAITEPIGDGRFGKSIPLEAPAGSVVFMHCVTPHSSLPNHSDDPRRTLIFEYRAADAYPIYAGPYTAKAESTARHIAGNRSQHARISGPIPPIPLMEETEEGHFKSLYVLQEEGQTAQGNVG